MNSRLNKILTGAEDIVNLISDLMREIKQFSREKAQIEAELRMWKSVYLDKPEDRLYHASDNTWWKRVGDRLIRAEPPPGWEEVR